MIRHPAKFSQHLLPIFAELLPPERYPRVLDPFAGTGRIHELANETVGVEIEPEWARMTEGTIVGDALALPDGWKQPSLRFDAICTSPCYGNRFADHHNAHDPSLRRSYRHDLGRMPDSKSSATMHWGDAYREFHLRAWKEAATVLRPGGRFVVNVSDHVRNGRVQPVAAWHLGVLTGILDTPPTWEYEVPTARMRYGANGAARVEHEMIYVFDTDPFVAWETEKP